MVDLPKGPDRGFAFALHKSMGMVAFSLIIARVIWRVFHAPPSQIVGHLGFQLITKIVHRSMYVLLFVVPVAGYLSASFTKYDMKFFGFSLPKFGWEDPILNDFFCQIHHFLAWTLVVFIVVHILGALFHYSSIKRMMFYGAKN